MKQYKFQNRSQKNSHSCVPLITDESLNEVGFLTAAKLVKKWKTYVCKQLLLVSMYCLFYDCDYSPYFLTDRWLFFCVKVSNRNLLCFLMPPRVGLCKYCRSYSSFYGDQERGGKVFNWTVSVLSYTQETLKKILRSISGQSLEAYIGRQVRLCISCFVGFEVMLNFLSLTTLYVTCFFPTLLRTAKCIRFLAEQKISLLVSLWLSINKNFARLSGIFLYVFLFLGAGRVITQHSVQCTPSKYQGIFFRIFQPFFSIVLPKTPK